MKFHFVMGIPWAILLTILAVSPKAAQPRPVEIERSAGYAPVQIEHSAELQTILNLSIGEVLNSYGARGFKADDISATIIDLRNSKDLRSASFMGDDRVYPASVVKMFYMAALLQQIQDGKITDTPELQRALRDMIVDSSNEATQYIFDVITDTSNGPELSPTEFGPWQYKRNRVNRYFAAMGYGNININQKTFCEDAYGRERQSRNFPAEARNRNMLTTDATARLMAEIVLGRSVNAERSRQMMDLMKRDPFAESRDPDDQARGFTGKALIDRKMAGAKLWSKAGWTSKTRHDAAYIETPDGLKLVIVIFTENHANDREAIPAVAGKVVDRLLNRSLRYPPISTK